MLREEQLNYCRVCKHRKPDLSRGMLCGLTGRPPEFKVNCESFSPDPKAREKYEQKLKEKQKREMMAGREIRFFNYLLDRIFLFIIGLMIGASLGILFGLFYPRGITYVTNMNMLEKYILGTVIGVIYFSILEGSTGRSLAKFITRTRVVDENGKKPPFGRIVLRSLVRYIPFEAFSFLGESPTGWHDKFSGTLVIKTAKKKPAGTKGK